MRKDIEKRVSNLETATSDWAARLEFVDYIGLTNYADGNWEDLHNDSTITVMRHIQTGEIRGVYLDRRTDNEYPEGAKLAYL